VIFIEWPLRSADGALLAVEGSSLHFCHSPFPYLTLTDACMHRWTRMSVFPHPQMGKLRPQAHGRPGLKAGSPLPCYPAQLCCSQPGRERMPLRPSVG
jgi:hypothetical protein